MAKDNRKKATNEVNKTIELRSPRQKAIEKGARNQPAAYLKILALLVPRADRQTQKSVRRQPRWVNAIKEADLREERGLVPVGVLVRESLPPMVNASKSP
jgi:hypothetical protein